MALAVLIHSGFVELPKPGDHVTASESFGTVECVKTVSEPYSPVSGEVTAVKSKLQNKVSFRQACVT